jgi:hypothetical protein
VTDPCSCDERCAHGDVCLGGHAGRPAAHWYRCDVCTPKDTSYRLADGRYLTVLHGCGHAVGPGDHRANGVAGIEHRRQCRGVVAALLNWAADEMDAQHVAHRSNMWLDDQTDHIRCFDDQPRRRSLVPWPEGVPRPGWVSEDRRMADE